MTAGVAARTAYAPGRVNLIGDHTDYTGGLVFPVAIDRGTTVTFRPGGDTVRLTSAHEPSVAAVPIDVDDPGRLSPSWARYVAGVVKEVRPPVGGEGHVDTTLPIGAGLSSSAALEVAVALALGFEGEPLTLARLCQRAEQEASGVPCGVMDQLASAAGVEGHALLVDCETLTVQAIPVPAEMAIVVVPSGQTRELADSAYADRRQECEAAEAVVGPLRRAGPESIQAIADEVTRRRARHVVTENERVRAFAAAVAAGDLRGAGEQMIVSHASLRDDFGVSTPTLDALVEQLVATPGVHGARLTGAGFGGCVVAIADAASGRRVASTFGGFIVAPSAGARAY